MSELRLFNENFKNSLYAQAKASPRKRVHNNIHTDHNELVQRLAIGLCRGTYIPPHEHIFNHQWEFFHLIDGEIKLILFSEHGVVMDTFILGVSELNFAVQIPAGTLHTLICLSENALIFEWKQGPFSTDMAKSIPTWALPEGHENVSVLVKKLEKINVGESIG